MELSVEQQILEQIRRGGKFLIALPEQASLDAAAAGLGLYLFIKKLGKDVQIATSGQAPKRLEFLSQASAISHLAESSQSLVAVLDTSQTALGELSYHTEEGRVKIYLKPKFGSFLPSDITFTQEAEEYDAVFILGCQSLDDLGKLFENHAEVFYETLKINIDSHPANEYYGGINLVDSAAGSISEITAKLLENFENVVLDEDTATALLAGIIGRTNSFQSPQTTPGTFLKAAELISLGGRQQEIVRHLFKTKPLPLLQLWGRALARMKTDERQQIIYSSLTAADLQKTQSAASELLPVLQEMLDNVSLYPIVALLAERENAVEALVAAHPKVGLPELLKHLEITVPVSQMLHNRFNLLSLSWPGVSLAQAEEKLLRAVKQLNLAQ